ncbi:TetR family transcriptional regulator [Saccharothrix sp. ALI-22-I]|uniref:TetR/AcrR family transcriptional regulator n=1 Tax=Saccharothrix sp. ALI-22-I TaxID=1933778 RepID=UPI00097C98FC|nr:TetR/AcrR family transcriptional regulator [Saccharothrix sp. ALI-22-I]ONI84648.1 TetR family transcriptional regulator [Saccharothrix sp. ALI-22-I]
MQRTAAETRSHVLRVAQQLFYWRGIRATGVDLVATEAGVAPTTLYRLFASKDELVGAYVQQADDEFRALFRSVVTAAGNDPRDQILALFDEIFAQVASDQCRGCAFLMTLAEFPDPELSAHRNAVAAKVWIRDRLGELTARLGVDDPAALADQLTLIFEGLHASSQSLGAQGPAKHARRLAEAVLSAVAPKSVAPKSTGP